VGAVQIGLHKIADNTSLVPCSTSHRCSSSSGGGGGVEVTFIHRASQIKKAQNNRVLV